MLHRARGTLLALALSSATGGALAQPSVDGAAKAQALFKDAIADLDRGDFASACPKFDAAMKLFSSPATQLNIAKCFEHSGKVASAWAAYQRALAAARTVGDPARREAFEKLANERAAALQPRLPRLRLLVSTPPQGLRVTENGTELPAGSFGVPLPVDPGPHEIVATAPGRKELRATVIAAEGQTSDVSVQLEPMAEPAAAPPIGAAAAPSPAPAPSTDERRTPTWAWVTGGSGIALLGVAAGFGVAALGKQSEIDEQCGVIANCPASRRAVVDPLVSTRNLDRGLFVGFLAGGGAALAAGIIGMAIGAPAKKGGASGITWVPVATAHAGGLAAQGRF